MTDIIFSKKAFFKTIVVYLILTFGWTFLCIKTNEFTDTDKGFVTGVGYLFLFSASIFFGQNLKKISRFGYLTLLTFGTFIIGSYGLGLLIGATTDSMVIYSIANSLFVSWAMIFFVNKIIKIEFKTQSIILIFLFLLLTYSLIERWSDTLYLNYHIHPRMTMFSVFQLFLIIPLTLGMTMKKPAHNIGIANGGV